MYILGVRIDNLNPQESLQKIDSFLCDGRQHYIVLPYADFLVQAQKDIQFRKILNEADLSLSDGIGPIIASYVCGRERLKGRVIDIDLIWALLAEFGDRHSVFLFGAKEGVAQLTAEKITAKYPTVKIAGTINGYVSDEEAITAINGSGAEILLVALGVTKQEKWIYNNLKKMSLVKVAIGVGGALDFISSRTRRAPRLVQKMGMEWLWRLFMQPRQWRKTWRSVIIFSWLILKSAF